MLSNIKGVLLDLDGGLCIGKTAVSGAAKVIQLMKEKEIWQTYLKIKNNKWKSNEKQCKSADPFGEHGVLDLMSDFVRSAHW